MLFQQKQVLRSLHLDLVLTLVAYHFWKEILMTFASIQVCSPTPKSILSSGAASASTQRVLDPVPIQPRPAAAARPACTATRTALANAAALGSTCATAWILHASLAPPGPTPRMERELLALFVRMASSATRGLTLRATARTATPPTLAPGAGSSGAWTLTRACAAGRARLLLKSISWRAAE